MIDNILKAFYAAEDRFYSNIRLAKMECNIYKQDDLVSAAFAAGRMKTFADILRVEFSASHFSDIVAAAKDAERELFDTLEDLKK